MKGTLIASALGVRREKAALSSACKSWFVTRRVRRRGMPKDRVTRVSAFDDP
jgi:hypothetical protein